MTTHADVVVQRRKIGLHHLAFLKGVIQDPDLRKWWNIYLGELGPYELRVARGTLDWLRDELSAAAHRALRPRIAALLRRDGTRIAQPTTTTLDQFAENYPPGFYSEAELTALFAEKFGRPDRLLARRQRLAQRQLDALDWIEPLVATEPHAQDSVEGWFESRVAQRLRAAGMPTLGDLVLRVNGLGMRWWSGVPGIGEQGGARILRFIHENQQSIGMRLGRQASTPRGALDVQAVVADLPRVTAIVPLERFLVPRDLDGSSGRFRAPPEQCMLDARNDYDAIVAWLASKTSAHTARAYRKEAERFLLWSIVQRSKPLSSMTLEDCTAYRDFLSDPQPREKWCGTRSRQRWGPLWRPFEGPLSGVSEKQAIDILRSLYEWLLRERYLVGNPWVGVTPRKVATPTLGVGRSFTTKQWGFIEGQLEQLPDTRSARRLRFVCSFAYGTGMRLSELVHAKCIDFDRVELDAQSEGWILSVVGKGHKLREVPIADGLMAEVKRYLLNRGLHSDPRQASANVYLIGRLEDEAGSAGTRQMTNRDCGISASWLYDQLKRFFFECSCALALSDKIGGDRIARASTHWLRHTFGSHAVARGTPLEVVQDVMGHASLSTTTIYVKAERKRRFAEMNRFWDEHMVARDRRRARVD